jgi:hypothetical protein
MQNLAFILVILALLILLAKPALVSRFNSSYVLATRDGRQYRVIDKYSEKEKAANLIADINHFTTRLIQELSDEYATEKDEQPILDKEQAAKKQREIQRGRLIVTALQKRYNAKALIENDPPSAKETSYTQNKGEIIALCLREKITGQNKFHSLDVIKFVMLHELAHVVTPELDHSESFWNNFRFLLEFAEKKRLYSAPNFAEEPQHYCGMTIKYNPVYDDVHTKSYFDQ